MRNEWCREKETQGRQNKERKEKKSWNGRDRLPPLDGRLSLVDER
jgi:hypothetical protein